MDHTVGVRELRQQASAVLRRVVAGQVVEVTVHGHPIARIVPIRGGMLDQLIVEGRASSAEGELLDLADQLLLPAPPLGDRLPSQSLGELRSEEV